MYHTLDIEELRHIKYTIGDYLTLLRSQDDISKLELESKIRGARKAYNLINQVIFSELRKNQTTLI